MRPRTSILIPFCRRWKICRAPSRLGLSQTGHAPRAAYEEGAPEWRGDPALSPRGASEGAA